MKHFLPALRIFIFMTLLTGVVYPLAVTAIAQVAFPDQAAGSLIANGKGSFLIGQKFENEKYFQGRPSAVDYNPASSSGSNLGPTSADLKKSYDERDVHLKTANPDAIQPIPQDLLFASGSGLDPDISVAAALYQAPRIAKVRQLSLSRMQELIQNLKQSPQLSLFGPSRLNVVALNLELDKLVTE